MYKISKSLSNSLREISKLNYKKNTLPNGIRIVSEKMESVRSVSIGVWINVGSQNETESENGISHFAEHIVFKGTKNFSQKKISQSIEEIGGYINAFTTKEHTCYFAKVLDEHIEKAIAVLSDLIQFPKLKTEEIEKEKKVVIEEIKSGEDDSEDLSQELIEKEIFPNHPIGNPISGTKQSVENFTKKNVTSFLHNNYYGESIVISIAGNFNYTKVLNLISKYFSSIQKNGKEKKLLPEILNYSPKTIEIEKPIAQSHIVIANKTCGLDDKRRYSLLFLNNILGEGMSSRLFQSVREKFGFAYSIYSYINLMKIAGIFGVYFATDKNNIEKSIDVIEKEFKKLCKIKISETELERTKTQIKGSILLGLESTSNRMMRLGGDEIYFERRTDLDEIAQQIDAVSSSTILETAKEFLNWEKFFKVILKSELK